MLIDTHAHLYLKHFDGDREAAVQRAREAGVEAILLPSVDRESVHAALALGEAFPGLCFAMAGVHPSYVREATDADWREIEKLAARPEVVAIGESGIDYYWDRSFDELQHDFLRRHVRLAIETGKPLVLHNRDKQGRDESSRDLVALVREERDAHPDGNRLEGVFHCFGPPNWLAAEVMALGFHVGLGGSLTFKNGGVPEAVADVPLERIVLETDAPYLAPVPHRGKHNEPAYVRLVAERLAALRGMDVETVEMVTTANARRLFGLPLEII